MQKQMHISSRIIVYYIASAMHRISLQLNQFEFRAKLTLVLCTLSLSNMPST